MLLYTTVLPCHTGALTPPLNYYRAAGFGLPRRRRRQRTSGAAPNGTASSDVGPEDDKTAVLEESEACAVSEEESCPQETKLVEQEENK